MAGLVFFANFAPNDNPENMKQTVIMLLCLVAGWQAARAQNTVESIRQRYAAQKECIASHTGENANDGSEWPEYYHMEASQFLPATGGHKEDTYMYFGEREEEAIYPSHFITFATTKFNYAAREYYMEFLYDPDGKVAFIYAYDPMVAEDDMGDDLEYEFRFYLNKGKLLKAIVKNKPMGTTAFVDVYSGTAPKPFFTRMMQGFLDKAEKIRQMFIAIENEAYDN